MAGLVVRVLEASLAAGDDVELVVRELQRLVDPHRDGHATFLSLLNRLYNIKSHPMSQVKEITNIYN